MVEMSNKDTIKKLCTQPWTIIDGASITLVVTRSCGHTERLTYGTKKAALNDAPSMATTPCIMCNNEEILHNEL
jgi:hypothetical protein